jgi:phage-related protein
MPTELPDAFKQSLLDPLSENTWMWLVNLAIPSETALRLARNNEDVTYDGDVYTAENLDVGARPIVSDGSIPTVTLRTSALNATVYDLVQATNGAQSADVQLIKVNNDYLSTAIPALEADFENLAAKCDDDWIYFTLGVPSPMNKRTPLREYSSSGCPYRDPALFKGSRCQYAGGDATCDGTYEDCLGKSNEEHWGGFFGLDANSMEV